MPKTGVLVVNLGTPDSPATGDVRRYLIQFLTDPRVIDIPWLPRQLLVRGIIGPFRAPKSAKTYREIWMPEGSPLMVYGERLVAALRAAWREDVPVELAMRYQNPSIAAGLEALRRQDVERVVVFPLFPQYASATTGSVHDEVMRVLRGQANIPDLRLIDDYPDDPAFIGAFAEAGRAHDPSAWDHVLFSYHGLPERQIRKADDRDVCRFGACCEALGPDNRRCYRAQCFATTRALAGELGLAEGGYTTCFQSRLGSDPWIQPYTSDVLKDLAGRGVKRLLVFCPAFTADCIETIDEIAVEYAEEFHEAGGEELRLVESLNDRAVWVEAITTMLEQRTGLRLRRAVEA
jgi:ferrochelatase